MSKRYITLEATGKKIPLGLYVRGIKKAKANPDAEFPYGLTCWWPCTGREILRQFVEGVQDRINSKVPHIDRGWSDCRA